METNINKFREILYKKTGYSPNKCNPAKSIDHICSKLVYLEW